MQRPLFDPAKVAGPRARRELPPEGPLSPAGGPGSSSDGPLSVTQLAARIDTSLKRGMPEAVRVVGEVSGFRERTHWYFDLKDEQAVVSCVMFASAARRSGLAQLAPGQRVVVRGRCEFYAKGGKVSFLVESLELAGLGPADMALRRLVDEARALGWLDPARKRAIPFFPRRVAVITSTSGAALQDVLVTMRRRCPAVDVLVVDVRVQGPSTVPEVVGALEMLSGRAHELGLGAIILTRGGGSMEDLWAFNEREVARAIVECRVPVVAAIGHETDTTLAELVADERCATPTQAAMRVTPDREELARQVEAAGRRLLLVLSRRLDGERHALASLARCELFRSPEGLTTRARELVRTREKELDAQLRQGLLQQRRRLADLVSRLESSRPASVAARLRERMLSHEHALRRAMEARMRFLDLATPAQRLHAAMARTLRDMHADLESAQRELHAVSPQRVLERGFSVTLDEQGRALTSAADAHEGTRIRTRLARGSLTSRVEGEGRLAPLRGADGPDGAGSMGQRPLRRTRARGRPPRETGPGLFG